MDSILYQVQIRIGRKWTRDSEHEVFRAASLRRDEIKLLISLGELRHAEEVRIKPVVLKIVPEVA